MNHSSNTAGPIKINCTFPSAVKYSYFRKRNIWSLFCLSSGKTITPMSNEYFIKGDTQEEIWEQINRDFRQNPYPLEYNAVIQHRNYTIVIAIDIDPGGG